jgi:hypothetical protein
MKFIIRRYLDGPIRVEKRKILLKKPIPIDASPPKAGVAISSYAPHFVIARLPFGKPWKSQYEIGFANTFSNSKGWRTRLLRRFAPRNDNRASCHCEPPVREAWQSRFANLWFANRVGRSKSLLNGMYYYPSPKNQRLPRLNALAFRLAMTKVSFASSLRSSQRQQLLLSLPRPPLAGVAISLRNPIGLRTLLAKPISFSDSQKISYYFCNDKKAVSFRSSQ